MRKIVIKDIGFWSYVSLFTFAGLVMGLAIPFIGIFSSLMGSEFSIGASDEVFVGLNAVWFGLLSLPVLFGILLFCSGLVSYYPVRFLIRRYNIAKIIGQFENHDKDNS